MAKSSQESYPGTMRENDRLVVGNWVDSELLKGEQFDTVLVDYLIGAIEGFCTILARPCIRNAYDHSSKGACTSRALSPTFQLLKKDEVGLYVGDVGRFRGQLSVDGAANAPTANSQSTGLHVIYYVPGGGI